MAKPVTRAEINVLIAKKISGNREIARLRQRVQHLEQVNNRMKKAVST